MATGIRTRFFSVFIITTLITVAGMMVMISYSLYQNFRHYQHEQDRQTASQLLPLLASMHHHHGWQHIATQPALWQALELSLHTHQPVLLDAQKNHIAGPRTAIGKASLQPIVSHGQTVGYLALLPAPPPALNASDMSLIHRQALYNSLIAFMMLLLPVLAFIPITSRLAGPIQRLLTATRRLTDGQFDTRLDESSPDELGQLARDFNLLAKTLERNEKARNQWIADISHELRTPLAVLRAQLEALLDGVRQADPDQLTILLNKTGELERLIDNLYQLSLSDLGAITYRKEVLPIADVLDEAIRAFEASYNQAGITLKASLNLTPQALVYADPKRLMQLFNNLLNNTLNYTDPGGQLIINAFNDSHRITVTLDDSEPGVSSDELEKLFDRLYRVEPSRNRSLGGSGLGLSICKNIIDAHNGHIHADRSALGGLRITVVLPLEKNRTTTAGKTA